MTLYIQVGVLGGTDICQACKEGIELAKSLKTNIEFSFNGINVFITPSNNPEQLVDDWEKKINAENKIPPCIL